ncbi:MAG: hypothetical protein AB7E37_03065 [Candidatus Altimarinota bacterium]
MNEKEMQNLYEVRKTVRFGIIPQFDENLIKPQKSENIENDLKKFISKYEKLLLNFSQIVFRNDKTKVNSKLKIKFSFLKNHTKKEYYENEIDKLIKYNNNGGKNLNQIEIGSTQKLNYLFEIFSNFEKENNQILEEIKNLSNRNKENKARKSDLGLYFNRLTKRTNFEFIRELFNENIGIENNINTSNLISETKIITQDLQKLILNIQKTLLPNESIGQVIEKASFNYYTVNKRKRDYEKDIEYFENNKKKFLKEFNINIFNNDGILNDHTYGFKKFVSDITNNVGNLGIEQAYNLMKEYKAEQKAGFLEFISKGFSFNDLKEYKSFKFEKINNDTKEKTIKDIIIYLFDGISEDKFEDLKKITSKVTELSTQKSVLDKIKDKEKILKLSNEITELKRRRGYYFFEGDKTGKFAFKKYGRFCEEYKKIAIEYGRIKANIKSLEKEKIDAEKTQSWALILEKDNNKYLLTIPRNKKDGSGENFETNLKKAKKEIDNLEKINSGELFLHKFESLTLRSLDKLCFGKENNTFAPNISKELFEKHENFVDKKTKGEKIFYNLKRKDEIGNKDDIFKNDKNLISFYKTVLSLRSTQKQIIIENFKDFETFINTKFENLEEFERELKKTCYVKKSFSISENKKEEIIKNFEAKLYKITSYDLQKNDTEFFKALNEEKQKTGLKRLKTNDNDITNLWVNFWGSDNEKNKYPIRLNPEISITYLEADYTFTQNSSGLKYNRKFHDRYLLSTTITQKALEKSLDLSFKEKDEIISVYKDYNTNFNQKNNFQYIYGLDRGENELVSLGVFDLHKEKIEERGVKIKVYELKKDCFLKSDEKGRIAYKNLSYFQFDTYPEFYEKEKEVSCIDLTTSKLINGKIYLNGDIQTYLNLKLLAAKRKIYEVVSQNFLGDEEIEDIKEFKILKLKSQKGREYIYKFDERYDNISSFEEIKAELEKYLKKVQENLNDNEAVSIQKVNNLRDAICANMIGIIHFLQEKEKLPGMIILEDLTIDWKNNTFDKSNTTLSSRFEQKLLQKISSLNLVPPIYKQILSIKDETDIDIKQLGIISYVNKDGTSKECPNCEKKLFGHGRGPDFENSMHHYKEDYGIDYGDYLEEAKKTQNPDCNYHMNDKPYGFTFIHSGDDLATYNIAKKGLEYIKSLN